jgi:hypothetical protein
VVFKDSRPDANHELKQIHESPEKFGTIILFKDEWTAASNATASYHELSQVCAMLEHEDLGTNKTATHCIVSRPTSCSTF